METKTFNKDLLSETRLFSVHDTQKKLTDDNMVKAITVNANLNSLGYTLKPEDIVILAKSKDLDFSFDTFKSLIGSVDAEPMYPDFPEQVMEITEAEYRFNQLFHYFSTYGKEFITGEEVLTGWLPEVESTEKTESDYDLLDKKVIDLVSADDVYEVALAKILTKKERMSLPEGRIISFSLKNVDSEDSCKIFEHNPIVFKENLFPIALSIIDNADEDNAVVYLTKICQHTGDVFKVLEYVLKEKNYHLTRPKKRMFVRVLENFSVNDLRENLILSLRKAEKTKVILNFIDYNKYSKSSAHKKAVSDLRDGKLKSWMSDIVNRIENENPSKETLEIIGKRSGMLLRMVAWLVREGYDEQDITEVLTNNCKNLSLHTLVNLATQFYNKEDSPVFNVVKPVLQEKLKTIETPLKDKKVFLDEGMFDLHYSYIGKSEEGGYIRQGMAFKIPETVKKIRFFVYWNDEKRIDIDLHSYGLSDGNNIHVGWNASYINREWDIIHSGDITHSNAAEYVDMDIDSCKGIDFLNLFIDSYTGVPFKDIDTCFVGMMGVNKTGKSVNLYDPKNCFFSHNLSSESRFIKYGTIIPEKRLLQVIVDNNKEQTKDSYSAFLSNIFSIYDYIEMLLSAQNSILVDKEDEADIVLSVDKQNGKISIIDENYFLDY